MPASADNGAGRARARPTAFGANGFAASGDGGTQAGATPPWLISYADLVMLLVSFFILLTSVTRVEQDRARPVMTSLAAQFAGVLDQGPEADEGRGASLGELRILRDRIQALVANAMPLARIRRTAEANRLEVELPLGGFFRPGETSLDALARGRLGHLLDVIRDGAQVAPYRVRLALQPGEEAAARAATLAAATLSAGLPASRLTVALDAGPPADILLLQVEFGRGGRGDGGAVR